MTVDFRPDEDQGKQTERITSPLPPTANDGSTVDISLRASDGDTQSPDRPSSQDPMEATVGTPIDADRSAAVPLPEGWPRIPNYELLGLLGRGGMGVVLLARDRLLNRKVAIKLPLSRDDDQHNRFLREARSAARLRHPNICAIHEIGEVTGRPYIVMDLIEGKTLRVWVAAERPKARHCAEVVATLSRALSYAHGHGVIHRDLKPSNVMMDVESGEPILMDFGLAKEIAMEGDSQLTRSDELLGTPAYMAPEQAAGQHERIGPATDIYALGAILYELLGGRPPFEGSVGEVLLSVQSEEPPSLRKLDSKLHRDLETICLKAMAKEPAERYPSAAELADDLDRFDAGEPIKARRRSAATRIWRGVARRPLVSAVIVAALAALTVSGYFLVRVQREREIAGLLASLEVDFNVGDWSAPRLEKMDATLAQLMLKAPEQAATGRTRLVQRFAADVEAELDRTLLTPEAISAVETMLDRLSERDAEKAEALRSALQRRLYSWQQLFDLSAPFSDLSAVLGPGFSGPGFSGPGFSGPGFSGPGGVENGDKLLTRDGLGSSPDETVVATREPSHGAVRLEVVFDGEWQEEKQLGLILEATPPPAEGSDNSARLSAGNEYRFLIRTPSHVLLPSGQKNPIQPKSFAEARRSGGNALVEILRGDTLLQSEVVAASKLPSGPLRIVAVREEDQLRLEAGSLAPLEFWDPFAPRGMTAGVFAVDWPPGAGISQLRALRRTMPEKPSPLQRGDALYAAEEFADALTAYREQAQTLVEAGAAREARYKEAMCLIALGQAVASEAILEQLAASLIVGADPGLLAAKPEERWAVLAACQVWLRCIQQNRYDEAHAIFASLSMRFDLNELAPLIPAHMRWQFVWGHARQSRHLMVYRPNPERVRQCERAVAIAEFFETGITTLGWIYHALVRAYRINAQEEKALEFEQGFMRKARGRKFDYLTAAHACEYCWLLRLDGQAEEALRELDYWASKPGYTEQPRPMLERVRVLAALGRHDDAEDAIDALLAGPLAGKMNEEYMVAWAMRGFLRMRRGDRSGAEEAWKEGARADWMKGGRGHAILHGVMLTSLADELTVADVEALVRKATSLLGDQFPAGIAQELFGELLLPPAVIRSVLCGAFQSPQGEEFVRKIVFREVTYADSARLPLMQIVSEVLRQGAMPEQMSEQQEAVLWKLMEDGYTAVIEQGTVGKPQMFQLILTWKGMTNFLGWGGVAPTLDPVLRGPAAYVLGHRYRRLGKTDQAAVFFKAALADAQPDSLLAQLAQAEL